MWTNTVMDQIPVEITAPIDGKRKSTHLGCLQLKTFENWVIWLRQAKVYFEIQKSSLYGKDVFVSLHPIRHRSKEFNILNTHSIIIRRILPINA